MQQIKIILLSLFIFFSTSFDSYASVPKSIDLKIGESVKLSFQNSENMHLSRKGVVDLFGDEANNSWVLTGLKEGFVILTPSSTDDQRIFINVSDNSHENLVDSKINEKKIIVREQFHDPFQFLSNKIECESSKKCLFFSTLNESGVNEWKDFLTQKYKPLSIDINQFGEGVMKIECRNKLNLEEGVKKSGELDGIYIECVENKSQFNLTATLLVIGSEENNIFNLNARNMIWFKDFLSKISANATRSDTYILGKPSIKVIAGVDSEIQSGGEFKVDSVNANNNIETTWKKFGIGIGVKIQPLLEQKYKLNFNVSISSINRNVSDRINANSFRSEIIGNYNDEILAGGLELELNNRDVESWPFIYRIPIISPILNGFSVASTQQKLFVIFNVNKI